jgi:enoyl-CoA hydratase/carnithine racemase
VIGVRRAVASVTIDREEALNALDVPALTELRDRLLEIAADESVRAVVLTGAGEKAFAAGADIEVKAGSVGVAYDRRSPSSRN